MGDLQTILSKIDKAGKGVSVQASTLGSLEALLQFLNTMKVCLKRFRFFCPKLNSGFVGLC